MGHRILPFALMLALASAPLAPSRAEEPSASKSCAELADLATTEIERTNRLPYASWDYATFRIVRAIATLQAMVLSGCQADPVMGPRIAELSRLVLAFEKRD